MPPKGRTASDVDVMTDREHIYKVPDMYVGSVDKRVQKDYVFDINEKKMIMVDLDLPEAVKRVTLEIISNAGDNSYFSRIQGVDPGTIDFIWDNNGYLSVRNGGLPIPVEPYIKPPEIDKKTGEPIDDPYPELTLIPETIFSVPRSSTNYAEDKDRVGCGRNGYGSKLTNIFSKNFIVSVGDSGRVDDKGKKISGQEYKGEWEDNMSKLVYSKATPGYIRDPKNSKNWIRVKENEYTGKPYCEVAWKLDFDRFKMKQGYSPEEIAYFCRNMTEFSLTCSVPVKLNNVLFDYRAIRDFVELFYSKELVDKGISHFCFSRENPPPKEWKKLKTDIEKENFIKDSGFIPESQIFILDTPDEGKVFSYVNGLITVEGGVHVDKLQKELFEPIVKFMKDKHKEIKRFTVKDVVPHVTVFLVCRVLNTKYNSQSKTKLESPIPRITFEDSQIKTMLSDKWSLVERLSNSIDAKNLKGLAKSDGKKVVHISDIDKLSDANFAGRAESLKCSLYIVEGKSAMAYPTKRIQYLYDEKGKGRDYNGIYPVQGKIMNVSTKNIEQISNYKEFEYIKKALGLKNGVNYSIESNFKQLRYGRVVLAMDADTDGMHIIALFINLFRTYWPELFDRGFITHLVTPTMRVYPAGSKKNPILFYDEHTFNTWHSKNKDFKGEIVYYKGLGKTVDADIKSDVKIAPTTIFVHDDKGKFLVDLAFNKEKSNGRKEWIQDWRETRDTIVPIKFDTGELLIKRTTGNMLGISFPPYMIDNLFRSIPSVYDGLKKSQRQVLSYALKRWNYGSSYNENTKNAPTVISFSGEVISYAKYHHGDKALHDTVIKMTRDYTGSNNLPIFKAFGQFGTREKLGKDAGAPRYVSIHFPWWFQYVFNKEMIELIPKRDVEGEEAEQLWIPCDIPLGIINGNQGVATGWSTYIPSHHPIAVVDWILSKLEGKKKIDPLFPFFKGFKGQCSYKIKKGNSADESESTVSESVNQDDSDNDDEEALPAFTKGRGFITTGSFDIVEENKDGTVDVIINEIPISTSFEKYEKFMNELYKNGKVKDKASNCTDEVSFKLTGLDKKVATLSNLKLYSEHPLTNMVMIDNDGIPTNYGSVEAILNKYIENMLPIYKDYRISHIKSTKEKITELDMEMAIIQAYLSGKLKVHKRSDEQIDEDLEKLSLSKEIFNKINLRGLSQTKVDILQKKIDELKDHLRIFESKTYKQHWAERLNKFKEEFERRKIYPKTFYGSYSIDDVQFMMIDGERSFKKADISYLE